MVIAAGLLSRKYSSVLPDWISDHAGDALWTVAVFLSIAFCVPRWSSLRLAIGAFLISAIVEFSQLINLPLLNQARATLPGKLLLGAGFLWIDLVRYGGGAILAGIVDRWWTLRRIR